MDMQIHSDLPTPYNMLSIHGSGYADVWICSGRDLPTPDNMLSIHQSGYIVAVLVHIFIYCLTCLSFSSF